MNGVYAALVHIQPTGVKKASRPLTCNMDLIQTGWAKAQATHALLSVIRHVGEGRVVMYKENNSIIDNYPSRPTECVHNGIMHLTKGRACAKIRDFGESERHLKIALETPDDAVKQLAYTALSEAYFDEKQERSAVTLLSQAVLDYPKNADYWKKLAIGYARRDVEQASLFRCLNDGKELDLAHRIYQQFQF